MYEGAISAVSGVDALSGPAEAGPAMQTAGNTVDLRGTRVDEATRVSGSNRAGPSGTKDGMSTATRRCLIGVHNPATKRHCWRPGLSFSVLGCTVMLFIRSKSLKLQKASLSKCVGPGDNRSIAEGCSWDQGCEGKRSSFSSVTPLPVCFGVCFRGPIWV